MTTNEPDGVPPVPSPSTDAAPPAPEAAPAAAEPGAAVPPPAATPAYGPGDTPAPPAPSAVPQAGQQPYAAQPPYGAAPYGYQAGPALPKGLSITAMVTGIAGVVLGFAGWGFLPALAGVIFGHIAQRREHHARPLWLTGLITGYVGLGLNLIIGLVIAAAIFLPLFLVGTTSSF